MTQAKSKPIPKTFLEYLHYDDGTDNSYELIDGKLNKVEPESEENAFIAQCLGRLLEPFFGIRRVKFQRFALEVPPLPGMPLNRDPDLVVLMPEHLPLMKDLGKMAITKEMPPPILLAEVVSPYKSGNAANFSRDYNEKPRQYAMRGVPEYWIIDPQQAFVEVNWEPDKDQGQYLKQKTFHENESIQSNLPELAAFQATVQQVLHPPIE